MMELERILDKLEKVSETVITLVNELQNLRKGLERIEEAYRHKDLCDQKHADIDKALSKIDEFIAAYSGRKDAILASTITGVLMAGVYIILRAAGVY